jgi:hypothetical protein
MSEAHAWPEQLRRRVGELLDDRRALATAIMATGEQAVAGQPFLPDGEPILRHHRRALDERSGFVRDADRLWWLVARAGITEAWYMPRTSRADVALDDLLARLEHLKVEAHAAGIAWPEAITVQAHGSECWASSPMRPQASPLPPPHNQSQDPSAQPSLLRTRPP